MSSDCLFPELLAYRKEHARQFVFAYLNVNGLRSKYFELQNILRNGLADLLAVSETKLDDSFPTSQFHLQDFTIYRADRNSRGGGMLCYVLSAIPHRRRNDILDDRSSIEHIIIELKVRQQTVIVAALYRPPSVHVMNLQNVIQTLCDKCLASNCSLYIIGDLNVNFKNSVHSLSDVMSAYDLHNMVNQPTCFKNPSNPTILDVILTPTPRRLFSCINLNTDVSDFHNLIAVATRLNVSRNNKRKFKYRSYKNFDKAAFQYDLSVAPFHVCCLFDEPDDALWAHNNLLSPILNEHAPLKTKMARRKVLPVMNGELRRAINVKAMLRRKFNRWRSDAAWQRYRLQRNKVNRLKVKSVRNYFTERCSGSSNGRANEFWDTIKPFISDKNTMTQDITLVENEKVVSNPQEVAESLNKHFLNIVAGQNEDLSVDQLTIDEITTHYANHPSIMAIKDIMASNDHSLAQFTEVTPDVVLREIKDLKTNKACGHDQIPAKLLKAGADRISETLTPIINMSIRTSIFPSELKPAEVSPVFKKSHRTDKKNYRPISVLPSISKLFESILCDQLMLHFGDILSVQLSAYRKKYSCCNVVLKCIEDWKKALDSNETVGCILMDLSKAFDSLPHGLLLAKLYHYGLDSHACSLIQSYLTNRKQRVKIATEKSSWGKLTRGVPQGSLTGPLLFNIYLNDLLHQISKMCTIYNYADDNSLSYHHENPQVVKDVLEGASHCALKWFKENFMLANPDKFQAIVLSRRPEPSIASFKIDDVTICPAREVKMLGFIVDDRLNFRQHVSQMCTRAGRQVNALRRLSSFLSIENKLAIYKAFIQANFSFGPYVYHFTGRCEARMMEKVNERALRVVYDDFTSSYSDLLNQNNQISLYDQRTIYVIEHVFKIVHEDAPPIQSNFFNITNVPYSLRSEMFYQDNFDTYTFGFNSLRIAGASMWNKLPRHIKSCDSLRQLKLCLKSHKFTCQCGICFRCCI